MRALLTLVAIVLVSATATADTVFGINGNNQQLVRFDTANPAGTWTAFSPPGALFIRAVAFRPSDGLLYGLSSWGTNLYTINTTTGVGTLVASNVGLFTNTGELGVAFNPVTDTLQATTSVDWNRHLVPAPGQVAVADGNLAYAAGDTNFGADPLVESLAYTNNYDGAVSTTLYGIDAALNILVQIDAASGALHTVGSLGVDPLGFDGFDISGATGIAYATLFTQIGNTFGKRLYTIDLNTGLTTLVSPFDVVMRNMALVPTRPAAPEPATLLLVAAGFLAILWRRSS